MGTNPNREKMPNRELGRVMGSDDDEEPQEVNVQEIASDPRSAPAGQGTNFSHVRKKDPSQD